VNGPAFIWLSLFAILTVLAFTRPAYGISLYMLSYFAAPMLWWWGKLSIGGFRWNLLSSLILAAAAIAGGFVNPSKGGYAAESKKVKFMCWMMVGIAVNATFVHFVFAPNRSYSAICYELLVKYVVLFFLMIIATRSVKDFRIVLLSILLGASYIGYEVTFNNRGKIRKNRLEGVGAPGASQANELASLMVTILPLTGVFLLSDRWREKIITVPIGGLLVNVILLCNSRGAFLSCIGSAAVFLVVTPAKQRKAAIGIVMLGSLGTWMLMGDTRIVDRFMTIFASEEDRDDSAAGRIDYWKAGLKVIGEHPMGTGGKGFNKIYGPPAIRAITNKDFDSRSVHNGYICEACEWGIQGGLMRLAFIFTAMSLMFETSRQCSRRNDAMGSVLGAAFISGTVAFLITSFFGDYVDNEWGYWVGALSVAYGRFYLDKSPTPADATPSPFELSAVRPSYAPFGPGYNLPLRPGLPR